MSNKPKVFEREERYMVVKRSKLQASRNEEMEASECVYRAANFGKALVTAVVVEEDWPEYPAVWEMLEERMTGNPSRATKERGADEVRIAELESLLQKLYTDLLMRAEVDSDGVKVVNLSNFLWRQIAQITEQDQKP